MKLPETPPRLATYGTLQPGMENHHHVAEVEGQWLRGTVRGKLLAEGWGAALGFPGIILDPDADPVEVAILDAPDLANHWPRLDAFEGEGYVRVETMADTEDGPLPVSIYALAAQP